MSNPLPPPPYKTPFLDPSGFVSPRWSTWFRDLFNRIGGPIAPSNIELEGALKQSVDEIELEVNSVGQATSSVQAQIDDLRKAPVPE